MLLLWLLYGFTFFIDRPIHKLSIEARSLGVLWISMGGVCSEWSCVLNITDGLSQLVLS